MLTVAENNHACQKKDVNRVQGPHLEYNYWALVT